MEYSISKHTENNRIKKECPLKYSTPENGVYCVQEDCAWFMIKQHACAINVSARIYFTPKNTN